MKILILGGTGFIGFKLAQALASQDHQIDVVDIQDINALDILCREFFKDHNIGYIQADLTEKNSLKDLDTDYDCIFHLAALLGVQNVLNNPATVLQANVEMMFTALNFAKANTKLQQFFFSSTSEVYAGTLQHYGLEFPTPEATPLALMPLENPRSSYMLSKLYGEALCIHSGCPYVILRPHNIYGPRMGMRHVIPELLSKAYFAAEGSELEVFSPEHKRTFCYIDDAISYIVALMDAQASNVVCNLGNPYEEVTMAELGQKIIKTVGKNMPIKEMEVTTGSPERRIADIATIESFTNIKPKYSLDEGIEKTFEWYKENQFQKEAA